MNATEVNKEQSFGENYFDSGKPITGAFSSYSLEGNYPRFSMLSKIIDKHFKPKRVLDIGCAKGFLVFVFREMGIDAFGVDTSAYALSCAPTQVQPYLHEVDLNQGLLPFENDYFDFITFFGTIEYLHNHRHTIREIERVLAKDGSLLLTTILKKPKNDTLRTNIHNKSYWTKEFDNKWKSSRIYYDFLSDYFKELSESLTPYSKLTKIGKQAYQKFRFHNDRFFVLSWDILTTLNVLDYGIILLTLEKK